MKVALYRDVRYGYEVVSHRELDENFVRVSEYIDVEFPLLVKDVVSIELADIERKRTELERKHEEEMAKLDGRKAVLQSMEAA